MLAAAKARACGKVKAGRKAKTGVVRKPAGVLKKPVAAKAPPVPKKPAADVAAVCKRIDMSEFFDHLKTTLHAPGMYRRLYLSRAYKEGQRQARAFTKDVDTQKGVGTEQYRIASTMWEASM